MMPFCANTAKEMLIEKERRIRDAMVVMGMRGSTFWLGWTVSTLILSAPIVAIMLGLELYSFQNSPALCTVISTLLFWLAATFLVFTVYAICR